MAKRKGPVLGTPATHPDHPNINEHVLAVVAGIKEAICTKWSTPEALQPYRLASSVILLQVDLFMDPKTVLEAKLPPYNSKSSESNKRRFEAVCGHMPGQFKRLLRGVYQEDPFLCEAFVNQLVIDINNGRSNFMTKWSQVLPKFMFDKFGDLGDTKLQFRNERSLRGYNNDATARFLSPYEHMHEFENLVGPVKYREAVNTGEIINTESEWPRFIYPSNQRYNPKYPDRNIFRGELISGFLRHTLTGPSTATEGQSRQSNKPSVAQLRGIKNITVRMVGFAVIANHWALSSLPEWKENFNYVDYKALYNNVCRLLFSDKELADGVLDHIDKNVPGLRDVSKGKRHALIGPKPVREDPVEKMLQLRRERAKRGEQPPEDEEDDTEPNQPSRPAHSSLGREQVQPTQAAQRPSGPMSSVPPNDDDPHRSKQKSNKQRAPQRKGNGDAIEKTTAPKKRKQRESEDGDDEEREDQAPKKKRLRSSKDKENDRSHDIDMSPNPRKSFTLRPANWEEAFWDEARRCGYNEEGGIDDDERPEGAGGEEGSDEGEEEEEEEEDSDSDEEEEEEEEPPRKRLITYSKKKSTVPDDEEVFFAGSRSIYHTNLQMANRPSPSVMSTAETQVVEAPLSSGRPPKNSGAMDRRKHPEGPRRTTRSQFSKSNRSHISLSRRGSIQGKSLVPISNTLLIVTVDQ
ncbi:hypothetical protein CC2G_012330 [Coprinopsis cinerea AmutBmut pab1-1]|nr:hypothetical protein CC2G_012330 [Coprinopsis cinerea AmutBmut pab1-1]